MNIMARFIIMAEFLAVLVIRLMAKSKAMAARVVVFAPRANPLMIPMF
jgi:hypothetical protein